VTILSESIESIIGAVTVTLELNAKVFDTWFRRVLNYDLSPR
jgi:hypothetical protein